MLETRDILKPYPGLRPFTSSEGVIFRGREQHTDRLLDILQEQRFLAVIGPSGSGKSSLVRAGLLPALPLGSIGTGSEWRVATMRPGNRPMQRLSQALLTRSAIGLELVGPDRIPETDREITRDVRAVDAELRRGPLGLVDLMKDAADSQASEAFNLLVLVDQFEEVFTYLEAGPPQQDESESFVNLLLASRSARDVSIFVALTMRTDFLGHCVRFLDLPDAINRAQYLTPRLSRKQAGLAITGPARVFGGDVESRLVDELINEVGNDPDQLPILQHALARMWDFASKRDPQRPVITWSDFNAAGGVRKALSLHAEQVLTSLGPSQEPLAELLFRAVTEHRGGDDGQAVRRPQTLGQIADWSGRQWEEFQPVVRAFAQEDVNFLIYTGNLDRDTVVDISHEALIRQWEKLRAWVNSEERRAGDYRRWKERRTDFTVDPRAVLTGGALARAVEWLEGADSQRFAAAWRPTSQWAARYDARTTTSTDESVDRVREVDFPLVRAFIERSRDESEAEGKRREQERLDQEEAERKRLDERRVAAEQVALAEAKARVEAEKFAVEQRARAESEAREGRQAHAYANRVRKISVVLAIALVIALLAMFQAYRTQRQAQQSAEEAREAAQRADRARSETEVALETANRARMETEDALQAANRLKAEADQSREHEEQARRQADAAAARASDRELTARAYGYWLPLGFNDENLTPVERTTLLQVARSDLSVRQRFLDLLLENPEVANRFVRNPDEVIGAAIGVSPATRRWFVNRIVTLNSAEPNAQLQSARMLALAELDGYESANTIVSLIMKTPPRRSRAQSPAFLSRILGRFNVAAGPDEFSVLGQALARLVRRSSEAQGRQLVTELTTAVKSAQNLDQIRALSAGLNAAVAGVPGPQGASVAQDLVNAMQGTKDNNQLDALRQGLVAAAGKLSDQQVSVFADRLISPEITRGNTEQSLAISMVLAAMVPRLPDARAEQVLDQLLAAIGTTTDATRLRTLGQALVAGAPKLTATQSREMADKLLASGADMIDSDQLNAINQGLAAVAAKLDEERSAQILENLLASISSNTNPTQLAAFGPALAIFVGRLGNVRAALFADKLLASSAGIANPARMLAIVHGLSGVASTLPESKAEQAMDAFLVTIATTTSRATLRTLGEGLAAAAGRLPVPQWSGIVNRMVNTAGRLTDSDQLNAIGVAVAALANRLNEGQARELADTLLASVDTTQNSGQGFLSRGLSAAAEQLGEESSYQVAQRLVMMIQATDAPTRLKPLGQGLAAFAMRLEARRAPQLVDAVVAAADAAKNDNQVAALGVGLASVAARPVSGAEPVINKLLQAVGATTDTDLLQAIGRGLAAAVRGLTEDQGLLIVDKLLTELAIRIDRDQIDALELTLATVTGKLTGARSQQALEKLLAAIGTTSNAQQLNALSRTMQATRGVTQARLQQVDEQLLLAIRAATDADTIGALGNALATGGQLQPKTLIELTRYPIIRNRVVERIRKQYPDAPPADQGLWQLIAWLQRRFPDIDLDTL